MSHPLRTLEPVRILHTSDWHLGRSLHGRSLLHEQAAFVDFLVDVVRSEQPAAVVIAGDLYDRSVPGVEAIALFDTALGRLSSLGVPVVAISGNHDSATRLGFASELLVGSGVHLRTDPGRVGEPILLHDEHSAVALYAIPYLEPELTWAGLGAPGARHEAVINAAMDRVRADVAGRPGVRSVAIAHAFVGHAGNVRVSESERDITVGGTAIVPAAAFIGVDYVALGHLHTPQAISERIAFSGAPISYSFSETDEKTITLVDLDANGAPTRTEIPCPVVQPRARVRATLESLLTDPSWADHEGHLLAVTLTDGEVPVEPMARLATRFPYVLQLTIEARRVAVTGGYGDRLAGADDFEIVQRFIEDFRHRPASVAEGDLIHSAFEAGRIEAALA